jgi:hypothetical protein
MSSQPQFHSPIDLLAGAEALLEKDDPHFNRAVVLEAISALEAYVGAIVFDSLEGTLNTALIDLLKQKTKMDFDSRLSVLVPVATGNIVEKNNTLWQDYKKARQIRNKVTHMGSVVTHEEAKFTVKTVYDWFSFLGSTAEIDNSFMGLKKTMENNPARFSSYETIEKEICKYFRITKGTDAKIGETITHTARGESGQGSLVKMEADIVVEIGNKKVVIEIKTHVAHHPESIDALLKRATQQVKNLLYAGRFDKAVVLFICRSAIPDNYDKLIRDMGGRVSIIPVKMITA